MAPGITAHPKPLPSPAWAALGRPRQASLTRSFGINKPWIGIPSN